MTNEVAQRIAAATIREADARVALLESESKGQREQARIDRTTLSIASRALAALIAEAQQ
jgi:hypothetical protein